MTRLAAGLVATATALGCAAGCSLAPRPAEATTTQPRYAVIASARTAQLPVFRAPDGPRRLQLSNPNEFGDPLVLLATDRRTDWVKVLLPVRPNRSTGWVRAADVQLTWDPYRIEVDLSAHRLTLLDAGRAILHTAAGVGAAATPTPRGTFYLTSLLRPPDPAGPYGTYAYGLSGFSPVLKQFAGGPGQIGLHGTDDPSSIGHSVTHGCIRVSNQVITSFAGQLPLGTPVVVHA